MHATECCSSSGYVDYPLSGECRSAPSSNSLSSSPTVARGLTAILYPTGRNKKYNLYVSWQTTTDSELSMSLNCSSLLCVSPAGNTQGFYIWSYKCSGSCRFQNRTESAFPYFEKGNYECLPIPDPVSLVWNLKKGVFHLLSDRCRMRGVSCLMEQHTGQAC